MADLHGSRSQLGMVIDKIDDPGPSIPSACELCTAYKASLYVRDQPVSKMNACALSVSLPSHNVVAKSTGGGPYQK